MSAMAAATIKTGMIAGGIGWKSNIELRIRSGK